MTPDARSWLAHAHGALAWAAALGVTAALGAALSRRAPRARAPLAAVAAALVSAAFAAGLPLDRPYRGRLRQQVFIDSAALGWLFERKLHLSFGAVALAWCALALLAASALARRRPAAPLCASTTPPDGDAARGAPAAIPAWVADLERGGRAALAASAALTLLAAIFSAMVAYRHGF